MFSKTPVTSDISPDPGPDANPDVTADATPEIPSEPVRFSLSASAGGVRIGAEDLGHGPGPLDGAWWPKSHDLSLELPSLVGALDLIWGRVTRIAVNPEHWPDLPKKVPVGGHVVHVGWFAAEQDPHDLLVLSYRSARWDLLVIPPETPQVMAVRLMAAASDPANRRTASQLIAQADPDRGVRDAWQAEGVPTGLDRPRRAA